MVGSEVLGASFFCALFQFFATPINQIWQWCLDPPGMPFFPQKGVPLIDRSHFCPLRHLFWPLAAACWPCFFCHHKFALKIDCSLNPNTEERLHGAIWMKAHEYVHRKEIARCDLSEFTRLVSIMKLSKRMFQELINLYGLIWLDLYLS